MAGESIDQQILHALGFAEPVECFLSQGKPEPDPTLRTEKLSFGDDGEAGPENFLDLGSGGGLPGLVLASIWPSAKATLLDANGRKAQALGRSVEDARFADRVNVVCSRAESAARRPELRGSFDLVVARSFGSPPVTAECASGFLRLGGLLVISEPPGEHRDSVADDPLLPSDPTRWPAAPLADLGLEPLSGWQGRFRYQVLRQFSSCTDRFPRREGIPRKRPLYKV